MYTAFYKLAGRPFQLSPDPRFFFGSRGHKKAMAYLTYGLNQGEGFIVVTGDIGVGKTTLVEHLFSDLDSSKYVAAKVVTTQLQPDDTLRMVAAAFDIPHEAADKATLLKRIESFFVESEKQDRRVLLVIDEAQNLPPGSLEELRMLSNFQLGEKALLQCFLLGQPQFRHTVSGQGLEQLRQRVIASYHLEPMGAEETRAYIEHRLKTVGWQHDPVFTDAAFRAIFEQSRGVPRRINTLCSRLLLFGFLEELHEIDAPVVQEVVTDLMHEGMDTPNRLQHGGAREDGREEISPGLAGGINSVTVDQRLEVVEEHLRQQERIIRRALEIAARYLEGRNGDREKTG